MPKQIGVVDAKLDEVSLQPGAHKEEEKNMFSKFFFNFICRFMIYVHMTNMYTATQINK